MRKIEDSGRQFPMSLGDTPLVKPSQDAMILRLEEWSAAFVNVRELLGLPAGFRECHEVMAPTLDAASLGAWPRAHERERIAEEFRRQHRGAAVRCAGWPDAPAPGWKLLEGPAWQPELNRWESGRPRFVCNCDMTVAYNYDDTLARVTKQPFRAVMQPPDQPRGLATFAFEPTGSETVGWSFSQQTVRLFFIVRPEIGSISELVRNLRRIASVLPQPWRHQDHPEPKDHLVAFAPPHADAARVCRQEGFLFLEYRPAPAHP